MGDDVNEAGEPVELFGTLELVLSEANSTKYKDVFFLKNRKKKPYQAKIWRPETKDHITRVLRGWMRLLAPCRLATARTSAFGPSCDT